MFLIEDERHAEPQAGEFPTLVDAIEELRQRAGIPWHEKPNRAPCTNWKKCGRHYEIVEYKDTTMQPWKERKRLSALNIDATGVVWHIK